MRGLKWASTELAVPDRSANIQTDINTVLGVVGKDYNIVQNLEAFSFFDVIVDGGDGIFYEMLEAIGQGERIFISKLKKEIGNVEDDRAGIEHLTATGMKNLLKLGKAFDGENLDDSRELIGLIFTNDQFGNILPQFGNRLYGLV